MEQQDRIMDGDLQTLGLQSILKMLALSGKTGTLFVHSGPETLSIALRKGQIVALREEGAPQLDLLTMLCLLNRLDPRRAQMIRELARGDMQVALALLVERGWMSAEEMQRRLEFAVTQSISHALRWAEGRFSFHRRLLAIESRMQPLDIDSVLLEALRQADEWEEMSELHLTRTSVARWLPEVKNSNDLRSLGLSQEYIEVLSLCNGEIPLQAISLALMMPEARVARLMARLLELGLIELVDTELEKALQHDLHDLLIRCQHTLWQQRKNVSPEQHLLNLVRVLVECINGLLVHHGRFARSLRGRGHVPTGEIIRYLERTFSQPLQLLSKQYYPILETASFVDGQLDCGDILTLDKLVKGEQLEEFYWEAVVGLSAFLRMVFTAVLQDEVGNSHARQQLNVAWKAFLTEIDAEIQEYQKVRAYRNVQRARGREFQPQPPRRGEEGQWQGFPESGSAYGWPETRRRSI
ncbi:DUF4388 domain-containing protein [Thermogemmatispora sp.]|uniref:DUF4388 domain-containing protein n=1 Tax=Thermogemmatispora sp. TaxID=1968838 RepID=UPI0035E42A14